MQFNREALEHQLPEDHDIAYRWMGKELGGLRSRDKTSEANAGEDLLLRQAPHHAAVLCRMMAHSSTQHAFGSEHTPCSSTQNYGKRQQLQLA